MENGCCSVSLRIIDRRKSEREREREICEEKWLLNMWCDRRRRCAAMWMFPQT